MSERNSQTPSTRQAPFGTRLKKALRLSSVPCVYSSPRTGTVSYEEQTVTDVTSVEVQTVVQACWSMLGSICLKSCDNVVTCPIIGACVRTFLFNKAVYRKSSRIRFFFGAVFVLVRSSPGVAIWMDNVLSVRKEDVSKSVKSLRRSVLFSATLGGDEPQPPSTTSLPGSSNIIDFHVYIRRSRVDMYTVPLIYFVRAVSEYPKAVHADLQEPALLASSTSDMMKTGPRKLQMQI